MLSASRRNSPDEKTNGSTSQASLSRDSGARARSKGTPCISRPSNETKIRGPSLSYGPWAIAFSFGEGLTRGCTENVFAILLPRSEYDWGRGESREGLLSLSLFFFFFVPFTKGVGEGEGVIINRCVEIIATLRLTIANLHA